MVSDWYLDKWNEQDTSIICPTKKPKEAEISVIDLKNRKNRNYPTKRNNLTNINVSSLFLFDY